MEFDRCMLLTTGGLATELLQSGHRDVDVGG